MEFKARLPEHNNNVTPRHPLKELATLLFGLLLLLGIVYVIAGSLVEWSVEYISPQSEIELYKTIGLDQTNLIEQTTEQDDPRHAELKALTEDLLKCVEIGYPVNVQVGQSKTANAVAFPGGDVLVFQGVYDKVKSDNGLAFILAHELAHFANRDHLRNVGRGAVVVALTSMLGFSNSNITSIVMPIESFTAAQFSQEREAAADALALDILNCHYGHVGGATEFFQGLQETKEAFDFELVHYFASHPQLQARIEQIQQLRSEKGYSLGTVQN